MDDPDSIVERKAHGIIEQLGRRIAELRRQKGWTQKDFAAVLNSSVQWVSLVERGQQNFQVHTLVRVALKLGVEIGDLLSPPGPLPPRARRGRPRKAR